MTYIKYTYAMSKRLQVVLDEDELEEIRLAAERRRMTVSEWVRQCLREARADEPTRSVAAKLDAVRRATANSFPTGDIDQLLDEIARGSESDAAP